MIQQDNKNKSFTVAAHLLLSPTFYLWETIIIDYLLIQCAEASEFIQGKTFFKCTKLSQWW